MKLDKNYLPYEYFLNLEPLKEIKLFNGTTIIKYPTTNGIFLRANLTKGVDIVEHYHNSKEYFYITKGRILVNGNEEIGEGDNYTFKPFELHKIKVLEDCEMYVQLIKDVNFKKFK